jgi:hypothetical protein
MISLRIRRNVKGVMLLVCAMPICGSPLLSQSIQSKRDTADSETHAVTTHLDRVRANSLVKIEAVQLFYDDASTHPRRIEINGWQETERYVLAPSTKFDVMCKLVGTRSLLASDFIVTITLDFLVAPERKEFAELAPAQLGEKVSWGQISEMKDIRNEAVYALRPGERRSVAIRGFDLSKVISAFPPHEDGSLWPWLLRVNVYVQDREGNLVDLQQRVLSLKPTASRIESR